MPLTPDYYPPFDPHEVPQHLSPRMSKALDALYFATVEIRHTLYRLALLHEITRDPAFIEQVDQSPAIHPIFTVQGALSIVVVMSICSVFDVTDTTASLRRVLKTLTDRREEECLRRLHEEANTRIDLDKAIARLRRQQERLNSSEVGEALARLKDLRDKELAHLDVAAELVRGRPQYGDLYTAFVFAANVTNTATIVAVRRILNTRGIYKDALIQARHFTAAWKR